MPSRILVVGDPHAHPRYSNERFAWLGRYVVDTRPDVVVCMGDLFDFPSLCTHSKKGHKQTLDVEGDSDAGYEAMGQFQAELDNYNAKRRLAHKARYTPRLVITLGNHDARPKDREAEDPELAGSLHEPHVMEPLRCHGWEVYQYKQPVSIEGWLFCHFFPSGTMGRPVGGKSIATSLLAGAQSCVVGHDHRFAHASRTRFDGSRYHAFSAGCYVHPDYREGWCYQTEPMWDRGVLLLDGASEGDYSRMQWVSQAELKRRYG